MIKENVVSIIQVTVDVIKSFLCESDEFKEEDKEEKE